MNEVNKSILDTKAKYREIFQKTNEELLKQFANLKPTTDCKCCKLNCDAKEGDLFVKYPTNCIYKKWQKDVLAYLENEVAKGITERWAKLLYLRKDYQCSGCATCCKLACSEFSPSELREKAKNGDNFAKQFTSVFIPYETKEEAHSIYPEYIEMLDENFAGEEVYFYHCPKLKDDRCSDYENRPQICRDFPDNPLSMLPKACGWNSWKKQVEPAVLMLHSTLELIEYYKERIVL